MNRTAIKNFAIWARRYLREQVKARAAQFGITHKSITEPQTVAGGLLVAGQTLNTTEANQYHQLRNRLQDLTLSSSQPQAVDALIDEIAYTWFNRLAALRFMEVNGYIGRVLSSSDSNLVDPDLLRDASSIAEMGDLPGLDLDTLNEWRSFANHDPNPDEFLYRRLLLAQCKALAEGIPALFDPRHNYQALFLPGNLLNQDSIVRRLVKEIPEEDWQNIEVVGWLYQFYISERKDEVIGAKSKVAAADIPAATQLFTPHWIVRYMVENSLGRLWLESHPESRLREYMPYYLENPNDNGEGEKPQALTPQELTVIDPACGSGHILVYAFDLLFEIYKEQGYLERDIPALILTHNLYGLDIDERAAQLASFAVLMKARAKNSRILRKSLALNIMAVRPTHSQTLPPATELNSEDWQPLIEAFKDADNLGSLITPPAFDSDKLKLQLNNLEASDSLFRECIPALRGLLLQAELLRKQYWVVVANPPYMGTKSLNQVLKDFASKNYPDSKSDAFSMFMERLDAITHEHSYLGLITPFVWMFLSSYETFRIKLLTNFTLTSLVQLEYNAFEPACIPVCAFSLNKPANKNKLGTYIKLSDFKGHQNQAPKTLEAIKNPDCGYLYYAKAADFAKVPGSAIAYWVSERMLDKFVSGIPLEKIAKPSQGMATTNNDYFLRIWYEVIFYKVGFGYSSENEAAKTDTKWFPYNKGGEFRRWFGNNKYVVNYEKSGKIICDYIDNTPGATVGSNGRIINRKLYFKPSITWSFISSSYFGVRFCEQGFIFDVAGSSVFPDIEDLKWLTAFLCSNLAFIFMGAMNPTLNFQVGNVANLPIITLQDYSDASQIADRAIKLSRQDWDNFETSWEFQTHPLLRHNTKHLSEAFTIWQSKSETAFRELQQLEEENNRYWIEAYSLQDELTPEVPDDQITIRRADLNKDIRSLISYAVGCIMGRYSLDKPGLIHAGQPFDPTLHQTLSASSDAIIPITDQAYFDNDIVTRFIEFLRVAYSPETLTENLNFIANALTLKNGESAQERIRRYFLQEFISDHIQTYKKRPIYWLFTSGKKRAFGALLYLHRYSEDALARIRTDYVLELQVKLDGEIARAQQQLDNTTSSAAKKAATNRLKELQAQQLELRDYQAKLQTQADARINLDLDDGVAYNYTRFKGLVYEGADLKIADLEKASQWKRELLKEV
ncbi:BREX-1 system adenine-specific DNA-methyltransferase PglX [Nostoc sphaeroides]|uniref:site-specific DNA-methyltransferase (adenine-specific) n=1 Tax=Nostoc sphaeroides CCNUC1 TaxID=2653204 RepID=A0A5P8WEI4_9NOSO|nr:BREX-1 system adenine-specific DNA-methyltransferase PglX [Nostoc sphaeroides]QFS51010.1 BREX-1 system adenine-specific DNA-methyltransferase PglX [Nostoc sphaeroides CCNUC1]